MNANKFYFYLFVVWPVVWTICLLLVMWAL
jgi:hypothetical protein